MMQKQKITHITLFNLENNLIYATENEQTLDSACLDFEVWRANEFLSWPYPRIKLFSRFEIVLGLRT